MDYKKLGFRAGLEIHQQLDTHKLFCNCPSVIIDKADYSFGRQFMPTRSELGDVDRAALAEAKRRREFIYLASSEATCMVEADEEPPHAANDEAMGICLTVASMMKAKIVDEVHFMRKIVIDGSNTTGFQRTALVALGGGVDDIGIETICLEEDAARHLDEKGNVAKYGLDRLGIPLIEIATAPEITSPAEAGEVAAKIGQILRATRKVRRGIGTIRQDLNVSIKGGNRVEIKGVQELGSIPGILENEVGRQLEMLEVAEVLGKRVKRNEVKKINIVDVSDIFSSSKSKAVQSGISNGGCIVAARLPGFGGLMGGVKNRNNRLGKEFAAVAEAAWGGIMHSDELPNYGISAGEVNAVKDRLGCSGTDGFVLSIGKEKVARECIGAVIARAVGAFDGVPKEVRKVMPDGMTKYMRPMPGAERMYPETDVPPISIGRERKKRIRSSLPEMPEERISRYEGCGLGHEDAKQIVYGDINDWFDYLVGRHPSGAKAIARVLLNIMPEIWKEGADAENLTVGHIDKVLEGLEKGLFSKEGITLVLEQWKKKPDDSLQDAIKECGLVAISEADVRSEIKKIILEHESMVNGKGEGAIAPLMGIAMKKMRGRADGSLIHKILKEEIEKA